LGGIPDRLGGPGDRQRRAEAVARDPHLPLILVTLGFFYLLINIAMVALAEWIAPNFSIDGFWAYVGTVVVVWAVNWIGGQVIGDVEQRRRPRLT
jgi:uncharacterized membrane protein YvlD (DUF360 family)